MTVFRAAAAWIDDAIVEGVDICVDATGIITGVDPSGEPTTDEVIDLPGVVYPGFANAHSHAFHRALRGRTHGDGGTFWTWRQGMYQVAATLNPDSYYSLARAVYGEMVLAGVTSVGEFHYVHHDPAGRPYANIAEMASRAIAAAEATGIAVALLPVDKPDFRVTLRDGSTFDVTLRGAVSSSRSTARSRRKRRSARRGSWISSRPLCARRACANSG